MLDLLQTDRLFFTGLGLGLFWVLIGWALLGEFLSPTMPPRNRPGHGSFLFGQAMALTGILVLALLCGSFLRGFISEWISPEWLLVPCVVLILVESACAFMNQPIHAEHTPIDIPSFTTGRDLILRHGMGLFLGLGLLSASLNPSIATTLSGGCVLGWGTCVFLWGAPSTPGLQMWQRIGTSIVGVLFSIVLLRHLFF